MLNRLPKHTASWRDLVADLGHPSAAIIARNLGVSVRTVERWNKSGAPRTAMLALWWLSREGHSLWDAEMANRTQVAVLTADSLWREVRRLRKEVLMTRGRTGEFQASGPRLDAANDPSPKSPQAVPGSLGFYPSPR